MIYWICFLCVLLPNIGFSDQRKPDELVLSTPDQLAHQDRLVGQLIGPLGGHLVLKQTDLVVKGVEPLSLVRYYIAPPVQASYHKKSGADRQFLYQHVNQIYRGWVFMPHLLLQVLHISHELRVTDSNGATVDYQLANGKTLLATKPHGVCNYAGGAPGGQFDLRNTRISREEGKIIVTSPEGIVRTYAAVCPFSYRLEKERLANGRVLRYRYSDNGMVVESLDPSEQHVYASMAMTGSPAQGACEFKSPLGQEASYKYDTRFVSGKWEDHKDKNRFTARSPPLLAAVTSPLHSAETIAYDDRFQLDSYQTDDVRCKCQYRAAQAGGPAAVHALALPVGEDAALVDVHALSYNPPVAGSQDGTTTVDNVDGTRIVYHYSRHFLPQKIAFYNVYKQLAKQTIYKWTSDQRLASIEWVDGAGSLLCRKSYAYDQWGNPTLETLTGDLTGRGDTDDYITRRTFSDDGRHLLLREETDAGKVTTFQYLPNTNLLTARRVQDTSREFWIYDEFHNLISSIADDGVGTDKDDLTGVTQRTLTSYVLRSEQPFLHMPEWTEESYWEAGQVHLLRKTHHAYDQNGNVCQDSVYGADGQLAYTLHRTYDARGQLLSETNALGQVASYDYDDHGRCISSCDFSGKVEKRMQYDARGRLQQQVEVGCDGLTHTTTYGYDFNDRLVQKTDPLGNRTGYTYDLVTNRVIATEFPPIVSADGSARPVITRATYDSFGRKISERDANGNTTTFRCNAYGSPTEVRYPDGTRNVYTYTKSGKLQQHIDPKGQVTTYTYDALDRLLKKCYLSPNQELIAEECFVYQGNVLVSETDREGHITHYQYDGAGRKVGEERCGRKTAYAYDSLGRLVTTTQQNGQNTLVNRVSLDLLGRVLESAKCDLEGAVLQRVRYSYDSAGNCITTTHDRDGSEAVENRLYDSFNRLISNTDELGNVTRTLYDETQCNALGQRILTTSRCDPNGVTTIVTHDSEYREVKKEVRQAEETVACYERFYDAAGNLLEHRDHLYQGHAFQKTQAVAYAYDSRHRATRITRAAGTANARTVTMTYSPGGELATKTLPNGITLYYDYNWMGRLQSIRSSDGVLSLTYHYDCLGQLLSASDERQNLVVSRTLDAFGNVLTEHFPCGLTISKTYDALDRVLTLAWSGQERVAYHYDALYLRSVDYTASNGAVYSHHYDEYDLSGHLRTESLIAGLGEVQHAVDLKGRHVAVKSLYFAQQCVYDAVDNLAHSTTDGHEVAYTYDALAQLTSETANTRQRRYLHDSRHNRVMTNDRATELNDLDELLSSGAITNCYDANGNVITKCTPSETLHFTYDPLNRLTNAISDTRKVEFTYDPLGRRVSKIVQTFGYLGWSETCREHYLYDGENEIGAFSAQGLPKQVRVLGLTKHKNICDTVAMELDGKVFAPLLDCQGNICRLLNPARGIAEGYVFDAFGKEEANPASYQNPWRYASKRCDAELGLVYFGKRYYDPQLARWLTTDPAGFIDSTNLYQYLLNNPFRYVDPDGRFVMALPLLTWGCAGMGIVLPSLTTIITTTLVTTAAWYATDLALTHLGQYIATKEWEWYVLDKRHNDPTLPIDPANDPDWEDISHPEAKANGHRKYKHKQSGKIIREDEATEGAPGHRGRRHYHHENPNHEETGEPEYYDETGAGAVKNSPESHLYHPDQYPGETW